MKYVLVWAGCLLCLGCAGGADDAPVLAHVDGLVLIDGLPLTAGTISFVPDSKRGTKGPMASGAIDPTGRFTLRTFVPDDGAVVGFHRVSIEAYEPVPPFDPENPKMVEPVPLIPTRYFDVSTSELTAEVQAGPENSITIELHRQHVQPSPTTGE